MSERGNSHKAFRKYWLLQLPEAVLVVLVLGGLVSWDIIAPSTAGLVWLGWVIKDIVLYPILRPAYEPGPPHGTEALLGARGTVVTTLEPRGTVRVGAELWTARAREAGPPWPEVGDAVRVDGVEGFTLIVAAEDREVASEPVPPRGDTSTR